MFDETLTKLAALGESKARFLQHHPLGYLVGSATAGIYAGFRILLIFLANAKPSLGGVAGVAELAE
jgi:hypothetical protein